MLDESDRASRIEHSTGLLTKLPNAREHAMEVNSRCGLDLDEEVVGSRTGEIDEMTLGIYDHEMDVERLRRATAHRINDHWTERDAWHKHAVHDVDMEPISACLIHGAHLLAQPTEVGREDRWRHDEPSHRADCRSGGARCRTNRSTSFAKPSCCVFSTLSSVTSAVDIGDDQQHRLGERAIMRTFTRAADSWASKDHDDVPSLSARQRRPSRADHQLERDIGLGSRVWRDVGLTTIRDNLSSIDNASIILATHHAMPGILRGNVIHRIEHLDLL